MTFNLTEKVLDKVAALIPVEMQSAPRWVYWQYEERKGKKTKVPYDPKSGNKASSTDPNTWGDFKAAQAAWPSDGIGFVLGDGWFGIDLDHVEAEIDMYQQGDTDNIVSKFVDTMQSYTEYSPSGTGIHIICKGELPKGRRRSGNIEMYDSGRYFTVTGKRAAEYELRDGTAAVKSLYEEFLGTQRAPDQASVQQPSGRLSNQRLIELAKGAKNGPTFTKLFNGQWEGLYPSHSEADLAFCNLLAFWTAKDPAQMDEIFRMSGLYRPKWEELHGDRTYGEITITRAIEGVSEVFKGDGYSVSITGQPDTGEAAPQDSDDLPTPVNLQELWDNPPPLPPALIDGVLRCGHKLLVSGPSKAGKSFLLLQLAGAIASGGKWLDFPCKQGDVLYVNLEVDKPDLLVRLNAIWKAAKLPEEAQKYVHLWNLRGLGRPLDQLEEPLLRRCRKCRPIAIIIDPIYKVLTGDENSATEMGVFVNIIERIAHESGAAVIYCHHHSKGLQGAKRAMDRASGSGVFARDPDALIDLTPLDLADMGAGHDGVITLFPLNNCFRVSFSLRSFPSPQGFDVFFKYPLMQVDHTRALALCRTEGQTRATSEQKRAAREEKEAEEERKQQERDDAKRREREAFDAAFERLVQIDGCVKISDLCGALDMSDRTVKSHADKYGYLRKPGLIYRAQAAD